MFPVFYSTSEIFPVFFFAKYTARIICEYILVLILPSGTVYLQLKAVLVTILQRCCVTPMLHQYGLLWLRNWHSSLKATFMAIVVYRNFKYKITTAGKTQLQVEFIARFHKPLCLPLPYMVETWHNLFMKNFSPWTNLEGVGLSSILMNSSCKLIILRVPQFNPEALTQWSFGHLECSKANFH